MMSFTTYATFNESVGMIREKSDADMLPDACNAPSTTKVLIIFIGRPCIIADDLKICSISKGGKPYDEDDILMSGDGCHHPGYSTSVHAPFWTHVAVLVIGLIFGTLTYVKQQRDAAIAVAQKVGLRTPSLSSRGHERKKVETSMVVRGVKNSQPIRRPFSTINEVFLQNHASSSRLLTTQKSKNALIRLLPHAQSAAKPCFLIPAKP